MDKFYPLLILLLSTQHTCQREIPLTDEGTSQYAQKIELNGNAFTNSSIFSRRANLHNSKLRRLGLPKYSEAVVLAGMREVKNSFNNSIEFPPLTPRIKKFPKRNSTEEPTGGQKSASFQQQIFIEHPMNPKFTNTLNDQQPNSNTQNEPNYSPISYTQNDNLYQPILNADSNYPSSPNFQTQPRSNFQNQPISNFQTQPRSNLVFPQPLTAPSLEQQTPKYATTTSDFPKKSIFPKEQQYQQPPVDSQYFQQEEQQYQPQAEQQQFPKSKDTQYHRLKKQNYQQQQKEEQRYTQQQPSKVQESAYQQQSNPTGLSDPTGKGPIIINYEEPRWGKKTNQKQVNFHQPSKLSQEMSAARVNIAPNLQPISTGTQFSFPDTQGRTAQSAEALPPTLYRYIPAQPPLPPQQAQSQGILFPSNNQIQPGNPSIPQFRFNRQESVNSVTPAPAPLPYPQGTVSPNSQPFRFNYNPVVTSAGSGSSISFPQSQGFNNVGPTQIPFQYNNNLNTQPRTAGFPIVNNVQGQSPRFFPQSQPLAFSSPQSGPYPINVFHQSVGQRSPGTPRPIFINQNQGFQNQVQVQSPPVKYSTIFPRPNSIQDSTAAEQPFPPQFGQARTANSNYAVTTERSTGFSSNNSPSLPQSQQQFHRESSTYPIFPTGNFNFPQQGILPIRHFQQLQFNRNYPMNPAPAPSPQFQFQSSAPDLGPYRFNNNNNGNNFQTQQLNRGGQIKFATSTPTPQPNVTTPFKLEIEFPPFIPANLDGYIPSKTGANYTMPDLKTEVINHPVQYKETMLHHQYFPNPQNPSQYMYMPPAQLQAQAQTQYQENPPQSNNLYQQYPLSQAMGLRNPKQLRPKTITKRRPKDDYLKMSTPVTYNLTQTEDSNGNDTNSTKEEGQVSSGTFQVLSRIFGFGTTTTTTTPAPLRSLDIVDIRHIFFTPEPLQLTESGSRSAALIAMREKSKTSKRKSKSKKRTTTTATTDDTEEDQEEVASLDSPAESQGETTKEPEIVEIMKEEIPETTTETPKPKKEKKKKEKTSKEVEIEEPEEITKSTKAPPCSKTNSEETKSSAPRPAPGTPEVQLRILWPDSEEASGNTVTPFKTITPQQVLKDSIWPQTGNTMRPQEGLVTNIWPYNEQALRHEVPFHSESQGRNVESTLNHYRALMNHLVTPAPTTVQTTTEDSSVAKSVGRFAGGVVRNVSNMVNFLSG